MCVRERKKETERQRETDRQTKDTGILYIFGNKSDLRLHVFKEKFSE